MIHHMIKTLLLDNPRKSARVYVTLFNKQPGTTNILETAQCSFFIRLYLEWLTFLVVHVFTENMQWFSYSVSFTGKF